MLRYEFERLTAEHKSGWKARAAGLWDLSDVVLLKRLRWQVELVFKRFKSLVGLGHLPKHDPTSARAQLYGKLLVALLVEKTLLHAGAISHGASTDLGCNRWRDFHFACIRSSAPSSPHFRWLT